MRKPGAVQLGLDARDSLLERIERLEDRAIVKEALPGLKAGPKRGCASDWSQVKQLRACELLMLAHGLGTPGSDFTPGASR